MAFPTITDLGAAALSPMSRTMQPVLLLSDGTLLAIRPATATTAKIHYSTDEGATWTAASGALSHSNNLINYVQWCVDEFDIIYMAYPFSGANWRFGAFSFNGTSFSKLADSADYSGTYSPQHGGIVAVDNPDLTGRTQVFTWGMSGVIGRPFQANFNRSTNAWSAVTSGTTYSVDGNFQASVMLECTAASSVVAATPSAPDVWVSFRSNYSTEWLYRYGWDGANNRFDTAKTAEYSKTLTNYHTSGQNCCSMSFYDPTLDKIHFIGRVASGTDSVNFYTFDMGSLTYNTEVIDAVDDAFDGLAGDDARITTDGLGNSHLWSHEQYAGSTTVGRHPFGTTRYNGTAESASPMSVDSLHYFFGFSHWNSTARVQGVCWIEDTNFYTSGLGDEIRFAIQYDAGGSSFSGWGIPMGIA